ncbi:HNH endonuclease [Marinilactibacillus sp. Marseille-P9653]|uniref:HNH endonuclease n=1 Tax=Marinilactibacillus sp. Marseille-P9653 TaxID=2866583 RepID=UPI001CE41149|nr:HNH endonuclease [Marinilactibacillus sp. Marseille-P9653]
MKPKFKNKYNNEEIKAALKEESFGKCMYCDTFVKVITYGHVEHIKPKSSHPHLAYDWENLGWSCQTCNVKKGSKEILNPYIDDLEEILEPKFTCMYEDEPENVEVINFISTLDLNRPDLVINRVQDCSNFERKLKRIKTILNGTDTNLKYYIEALNQESNVDQQYYIFKRYTLDIYLKAQDIDVENFVS